MYISYQSGSFSLINVGRVFTACAVFSFFYISYKTQESIVLPQLCAGAYLAPAAYVIPIGLARTVYMLRI